MRVPNNDVMVCNQLESLNLGRVWRDDGSVGVVCEDSRLNEVREILGDLNLPGVGDGVQEGSIWLANESGSVNEEL